MISIPSFRMIAAGAALLALAGCQSIVPGANRAPPAYYDLTPKSTYPDDLPRVDAQMIVELPSASAGLTTSRIALKTHPTRLNYYASAEWSDIAPRLVQTLMIESFENTNRIIAVSREGSGLRSDYVLKVDLREFQAELYEGAQNPTVRVRLSVRLVRMPERLIIAGHSEEWSQEAESDRLPDVIETFDEVLGHVMKRIVTWTIRAADADQHRGSGN
jgi:cholesterol transport system auxiliary component